VIDWPFSEERDPNKRIVLDDEANQKTAVKKAKTAEKKPSNLEKSAKGSMNIATMFMNQKKKTEAT
jgi:hypothetical protein